jgi:hypothetical protein
MRARISEMVEISLNTGTTTDSLIARMVADVRKCPASAGLA